MPCRVRKEVRLEPLAGARIKEKRKLPPTLFSNKKSKLRGEGGGYLCSKSKTRDCPCFAAHCLYTETKRLEQKVLIKSLIRNYDRESIHIFRDTYTDIVQRTLKQV